MIYFITRLAVLHFVFFYFFNYILAFPIAVFTMFIKNERRGDKVGHLISRTILVTVFSSLSSEVVLLNSNNTTQLIIYGLIAGILLLFNLMYNFHLMRQQKIERNLKKGFGKHFLEKDYQDDNLFLAIALTIYILTFFIPFIGNNPVNNLFFKLTIWLMNIQILNWIITILSFLFLIKLFWKMYLTVMGVWIYQTTHED